MSFNDKNMRIKGIDFKIKSEYIEIILVVFFSLAMLLIITLRTNLMTYEHPYFSKPWDHHKYIYMAQNPFSFHIAPFCWRIINPLIAYILPFNILVNFFVISFLSLWATALLIYYLLKQLDFSFSLSFCGMFLYLTLGWATKQNLHNFWLTDGLAFFVFTLGILLIYKRNTIGFLLLVTIGVLVKEFILLLLLLYYFINTTKLIDKDLFWRTLLLSILPILIFFFIRILIPDMSEQSSYLQTLPNILSPTSFYQLYYDIDAFGEAMKFNTSIVEIVKNVVGTFGVILVSFSLLLFMYDSKLVIKFSPIILFSLLIVFFPIINTQRVMIFSFPLLIILTMSTIKFLIAKYNISINYFIILFIVFYAGNLIDKDRISLNLRYQLPILFLFLILIILQIKAHKKLNENCFIR